MVGSVTWGVEQLVRKALSHTVVPRVSARSTVLRWGHSSKLVAHSGVGLTMAAILVACLGT